jgi:hypothetical protein
MRLPGFAAAAVVFLVPLAILAQHSAAPAPPTVIPIATHIPSAPSASIHSSSIFPPRNSEATARTGAQGSYPVARANHELNAPRTKDKILQESSSNSAAEKPGFFSFIRKRANKCKNDSCEPSPPSASLISQVHAVTPVAPEAYVSCLVVPFPNSAIPCNMHAPCCP